MTSTRRSADRRVPTPSRFAGSGTCSKNTLFSTSPSRPATAAGAPRAVTRTTNSSKTPRSCVTSSPTPSSDHSLPSPGKWCSGTSFPLTSAPVMATRPTCRLLSRPFAASVRHRLTGLSPTDAGAHISWPPVRVLGLITLYSPFTGNTVYCLVSGREMSRATGIHRKPGVQCSTAQQLPEH